MLSLCLIIRRIPEHTEYKKVLEAPYNIKLNPQEQMRPERGSVASNPLPLPPSDVKI